MPKAKNGKKPPIKPLTITILIPKELGLTQDWPVVIVGAGNLGRALANYGGFASRGFRVAALVDSDPAVVGSIIAGLRVRRADEIEKVWKERAAEKATDANGNGSRVPGKLAAAH